MYRRITIKVGSNVLAAPKGNLDVEQIKGIVEQLAYLRKSHVDVILVSSGAVAAGRGLLQDTKPMDTISNRQLYSSVGQVHLINTYNSLLAEKNLRCAQVLVTKEDFRDRVHYLNLKNCISVLLQNGIIPIVNENDAISINELMFTDNDELSGMLASMTGSEALMLLTNVDGILDGVPGEDNVKVIMEANDYDHDISHYIQVKKSDFGRGGMVTKFHIAQKISKQGITVYIANGKRKSIITDIYNNREVPRTRFGAHLKKSTVKKWIADSDGFAKGIIVINEGAKQALQSNKATSLLPVGITKIDGDFRKGDIIKIIDEQGMKIGLGKAMYSVETARTKLGHNGEKPIVHYDYLYLE